MELTDGCFHDDGMSCRATVRYVTLVSLTRRWRWPRDETRNPSSSPGSWGDALESKTERSCVRLTIEHVEGKSRGWMEGRARQCSTSRLLPGKLSLLSWLFTPPSSIGSTRETRRRRRYNKTTRPITSMTDRARKRKRKRERERERGKESGVENKKREQQTKGVAEGR